MVLMPNTAATLAFEWRLRGGGKRCRLFDLGIGGVYYKFSLINKVLDGILKGVAVVCRVSSCSMVFAILIHFIPFW
jgi:hypothetical protein